MAELASNHIDVGLMEPVLILSSHASGEKHGYAMMEDILEFSGIQMESGLYTGQISVRRVRAMSK